MKQFNNAPDRKEDPLRNSVGSLMKERSMSWQSWPGAVAVWVLLGLFPVADSAAGSWSFTYDTMDRLATRTDPLGRTERYEYDQKGNLRRFTDRKSQVTAFGYDSLNRLIDVQYADGSSTGFSFDSVGRLATVTDSISGSIQYSYDQLDRLIQEITSKGTISYQYDAIGRRTSMTVAGLQPVTYTYDAASQLTQVAQGSRVVSFTYDAAGRPTTLSYPNGTVTSYAWDAASRLISISSAHGASIFETVTYQYDAASNIVGLTRQNGVSSSLPQSVQAVYDAANQQTHFNGSTPNLTYDANGNLTSHTDASGTTTYTWDARNRLTGISGPGISANFIYDGLNRRISKTINGVTIQYLYDVDDAVVEIRGGAVFSTYLRSLNTDEVFARYGSSTEYFHTDVLGSTLALSNEAGVVKTTYAYDPFVSTTPNGTPSTNPFQFTGRENDGTGLYYHRARYYSPSLHRFLSEDPLDFESGDVNFYAYVFNNPINFTDPTGEIVPLLLFCARGALTNLAIDILSRRKPEIIGIASGCIPGLGQTIRAARPIAKDILQAINRFRRQKLGQQLKEYNTLRKTYQQHLQKYGQEPGKTTGETNRIERQLNEYQKLLQKRGQNVGSGGGTP